jgi:hypothetical protein
MKLRPAWSPSIEGVPVLEAEPLGDEWLMVDCPHCRRLHFHARAPDGSFGGPRDAHCIVGPLVRGQYRLVPKQGEA